MAKKFKKISDKLRIDVETQVKSLLTSSRKYMKYPPDKITYDVNHGDYAEAFGVMRGLSIMGYGDINFAVNTPEDQSNLRWWFNQMEREVLSETGYVDSRADKVCQ